MTRPASSEAAWKSAKSPARVMARAHGKVRAASVRASTALIIFAICIIGIAVGSGSLVGWAVDDEFHERKVERTSTSVLMELANRLTERIDVLRDTLSLLASQPMQIALSNAEEGQIFDMLVSIVLAKPFVSSASFIDETQTEYRVWLNDGVHREVTRHNGESPSSNALDCSLGAATRSAWSGPVIDVAGTGESVYVLCERFGREDWPTGAISLTVPIRGISDLLDQSRPDVGQTSFILADDRHLLAHPNIDRHHPAYQRGSPIVEIGNAGDLVLQELLEQQNDPQTEPRFTAMPIISDAEAAPVRQIQHVETELRGSLYTLTTMPFELLPGMSVTLGSWFNSDNSKERKLRFYSEILTGTLTIAVVLPICIFIAQWASRTIKRSAAASQGIANLHFDLAETLERGPVKEMNDLIMALRRITVGMTRLKRYIAPTVIEHSIRADGQDLISHEHKIAIMFTDIVDFTSMSEELSPGATSALLNEIFDAIAGEVDATQGTIDKYIGDSLMAFWGAPIPIDNPADAACGAAMRMGAAIDWLNRRRIERGEIPVRMRIGIHYGPALVGNIGSRERVNYTVVGDTVNTAQRLEAWGKNVDTRDAVTIVVSETVARMLPSSMPSMDIGEIRVKGKSRPLRIYRLKP